MEAKIKKLNRSLPIPRKPKSLIPIQSTDCKKSEDQLDCASVKSNTSLNDDNHSSNDSYESLLETSFEVKNVAVEKEEPKPTIHRFVVGDDTFELQGTNSEMLKRISNQIVSMFIAEAKPLIYEPSLFAKLQPPQHLVSLNQKNKVEEPLPVTANSPTRRVYSASELRLLQTNQVCNSMRKRIGQIYEFYPELHPQKL